MKNTLVLPALKGSMGDWIYYVCLMKFSDLADRVSMVDEIHKNKELRRLIQREVSQRTSGIVDYLISQEQRFFNTIILGTYGGNPSWREVELENKSSEFDEPVIDNLDRSFGILSLSGEEVLFAIDGQHRTKAIREAIKLNKGLGSEEVSIILVAHDKSRAGEVRTRRLFSTLNRYAVPVRTAEIIALDEEDNCAIITRNLVEDFSLFEGKIEATSKGRSISRSNSTAFTNIVLLYDILVILLTDKKLSRLATRGENFKTFTRKRVSEKTIARKQGEIQKLFGECVRKIPSLRTFFRKGIVDRNRMKTSLLFRPIGQTIFFSVLKLSKDAGKKQRAMNYFAKDTFNLANRVWRRIFWDQESKTIKTDKVFQGYAIRLILKHLGIDFQESRKDKELSSSFGINPRHI